MGLFPYGVCCRLRGRVAGECTETALETKKAPTLKRTSACIYWLGRQGSNLGMPESKSGALPLGDAPICFGYEILEGSDCD